MIYFMHPTYRDEYPEGHEFTMLCEILDRVFDMDSDPPDIITPQDCVLVHANHLSDGPIRPIGGRIVALFFDDYVQQIVDYKTVPGMTHDKPTPARIFKQLCHATDRVTYDQVSVAALKLLWAMDGSHGMQPNPTAQEDSPPPITVLPIKENGHSFPVLNFDNIVRTWIGFFQDRRIQLTHRHRFTFPQPQ